MLRPAHAHPWATLRLPVALPRSPAQCGAAQQPGRRAEGLKSHKGIDQPH